MKVRIDKDELYPHYLLGNYGDEIDMPPQTVELVLAAQVLFDKLQDILASYHLQATKTNNRFNLKGE